MKLGEYLRDVRKQRNITLNDVFNATKITNSRMSKAEKGDAGNLKYFELRKLALLYDVSVIQIYMRAGLLDESDLEQYCSTFKDVGQLDEEDKKHIQSEIDYILKKKG